MRLTPSRDLVLPFAAGRMVTPGSPEFGSAGIIRQTGATATGAWFSANDPLAVPFALANGGVVGALGWINGSSAGDNVDVGIYDTAWNRLVSTGSIVGSGSNLWQYQDVTDVAIPPGRYYLVMARSTTTTNRQGFYATTASALVMSYMGCQDSATDAFPLPNPLTNMAAAATATRIPVMGMMFREAYT